MSNARYSAPSPRPSVADPELVRPDWTSGAPRDAHLLWLDKNENGDPQLGAFTSQLVRETLMTLDARALSTYPECGPLYRKLGAKLGVDPECLLLAAGSDGVIRSVFEAFIEPGDVVMHTAPTFAMYPVYSRMYGARTQLLEYEPSSRGPVLSADAVRESLARQRPKLLCLPNPDSPTGTVFSSTDLRGIVEAAGEVGALVLLDEAYYPFYEHTAVPWVREYGHVVIARTFAKAWGLAGLRIGHAVAAPAVARLLHKVRPMYEVNTVAVAVMERMLDHEEEMLAAVRRLNAGRDHLVSAMERLGFRTVHAKGNFMHVAFRERAPAVHAALKDLVLYRLDHKEPCLRGFTRFSAPTMEAAASITARIEAICADERGGRQHV